MGEQVKYNGEDNKVSHQVFKQNQVITCCPEVDGGLPTPRTPSEIIHNNVQSKDGKDVTTQFKKGANIALNIVKNHNIKVAILKSKSPSCSNNLIYDGTFSNKLIKGKGITASLLEENGIKVFNENQLDNALEYINNYEK